MRRLVMVVCAALLLLSVVLKSRTSQETPGRAAFPVLSSGRVTVKVSGDVRHSGIYNVPANSLAENAIIMAVPSSPLNSTVGSQATPALSNGSAVTIKFQPDGRYSITYGVITVSERLVLGIPLDIDTMTEADFDLLPGVGPALAKRIIAYRQKNGGILRVEDLKLVEGVGDKKYKAISYYFQPVVYTE